jgi:hypothetical protein
MKMQEIKEIAKKWGIPFKVGLSKQHLIRDIQIREGFSPCFRTKASCWEKECLWLDECIPPAKDKTGLSMKR